MNQCSPAYCSDGSKNWALCNMAQWNPRYRKYCKSESRCRKSRKNTISTDQVDAKELHRKMPYIWRHLDRKTRLGNRHQIYETINTSSMLYLCNRVNH